MNWLIVENVMTFINRSNTGRQPEPSDVEFKYLVSDCLTVQVSIMLLQLINGVKRFCYIKDKLCL